MRALTRAAGRAALPGSLQQDGCLSGVFNPDEFDVPVKAKSLQIDRKKLN